MLKCKLRAVNMAFFITETLQTLIKFKCSKRIEMSSISHYNYIFEIPGNYTY